MIARKKVEEEEKRQRERKKERKKGNRRDAEQTTRRKDKPERKPGEGVTSGESDGPGESSRRGWGVAAGRRRVEGGGVDTSLSGNSVLKKVVNFHGESVIRRDGFVWCRPSRTKSIDSRVKLDIPRMRTFPTPLTSVLCGEALPSSF